VVLDAQIQVLQAGCLSRQAVQPSSWQGRIACIADDTRQL
jgi:hypothetical protein